MTKHYNLTSRPMGSMIPMQMFDRVSLCLNVYEIWFRLRETLDGSTSHALPGIKQPQTDPGGLTFMCRATGPLGALALAPCFPHSNLNLP
jgi:hypothetical protein